MDRFIGRTEELKRLESTTNNGPALVVIRGRRRIGKSRLVQEYAKNKRFLEFSGLAPTERMTAQTQRDHFANQLIPQLKIPACTFNTWYDAFLFLSNQLTDESTVIFFDEISWMAEGDPTFIPTLKVWWDTVLQKHTNVQLILCSSVSIWVEKNIINSTALFGRISLILTLEELILQESYEFLKNLGFKGSDQDVFKLLSITGGVPWYLKQFNPKMLVDENIKNLCFTEGGLLTKEFDRIFNDLYAGESELYKKIVYALAEGMKTFGELRSRLKYGHGGFLRKYLENLCVAGFVTQHTSWSFKMSKQGRQSLFRLSDNYLRFYVKYIEPNLSKIKQNAFADVSIDTLPGWQSMMGIHIENLLLKHRGILLKALGIYPETIVVDNPYVQKGTKQHRGCQIDYLIQLRTQTLIVCEFKFQNRTIGSEIIKEMEEKIKCLSVPKGFGRIPALVHISDLADSVIESNYFYKTVDLRDWLTT